jgi:glycosyltransferase involved in cell wall biosynthesis
VKALFVNPGGMAYGSGRSMLSLLQARRFEAEVVCPGGGKLEQELQQLGIKVHPLEFGKYSLRQNPFWHLNFYRQVRRILKQTKPDVVVINLDGNTPWVTLAAVRAGIPIVRFSRFEFKPPTRWLDRWGWLKASAIICPSELVRQQVLDWAPPEIHDRVHRLYEACMVRTPAPGEIAGFRRRFGLGVAPIIAYVGRMHRGKRIETALEALARVRGKISNAQLVIVGGYDGSAGERIYQQELVALADRLGITKAVTFTGYLDHDQIPVVIAAAQVVILPSESESFGLVLVEAWAQGIPTVASDVSGCREITRAAGGGHLCPVGDADEFSRRIIQLLEDFGTAAATGAAGKRWVQEECAAEKYATRFYRLLQASPDGIGSQDGWRNLRIVL